jgi:hypothetical protein
MISIVNERLATPEDGAATDLDVVEKAGIRTGADSRLDGTTAHEVRQCVAATCEAERIVLHFHGGLVNRGSGERIASSFTSMC